MKRILSCVPESVRNAVAHVFQTPKDMRELRMNQDTGLIKIFACLFMLCDHMGKMIFPDALKFKLPWLSFVPSGNILRLIGRLAMPMFCYCIAVGCKYTRNIWKYALRLLLLAILVHPLYMTAMGHVKIGAFDWAKNFYRLDLIYEFFYTKKLNILFSLVLGTFILAGVRSKTYVFCTLFSLIAWSIQGQLDYGIKAIVLIVLFYAFLDRPFTSFLSLFLYVWYMGMPSYFTMGRTSASTEIYALLSLPLLYIPMKRRVKLPKWAFYAFYPGHLLLIYLLQYWRI